jgi:hypothetical protein
MKSKNNICGIYKKKSLFIFWVLIPCGLVGRCQSFRVMYYLHHQGISAVCACNHWYLPRSPHITIRPALTSSQWFSDLHNSSSWCTLSVLQCTTKRSQYTYLVLTWLNRLITTTSSFHGIGSPVCSDFTYLFYLFQHMNQSLHPFCLHFRICFCLLSCDILSKWFILPFLCSCS